MKQSKRTENRQRLLAVTAGLFLAVAGNHTAQAYSRYTDGCNNCHGAFYQSSTSPKGTVFPSNDNHFMHNDPSTMGNNCNLCHSGTSRTPVYTWRSNGTSSIANDGLGCSGCHVGPGLRKHHQVNGVPGCTGGCHSSSEVSAPENVDPPYYGGVWASLTKVRNAGNTVLASNTNENWSVGDFLGLDNDGNNLYDLADYAVGPRDRILSSTREGNDIRVTWQTYGGRTNTVQAAGNVSGAYSGISPAITTTNVGPVTTNYLEVGGALNSRRFYRLSAQLP